MNSRYVILLLFAALLIYRQWQHQCTVLAPIQMGIQRTPPQNRGPVGGGWGAASARRRLPRQLELLAGKRLRRVLKSSRYTGKTPSPLPAISYLSDRWAEVLSAYD